MEAWERIKYPLWHLLAYTRIPGNALSFAIRQALHWSRGRPALWQEAKDGLFDYQGPAAGAALERERELAARYRLEPLKALSTAALYRKNLYLLDCLEKAAAELPPCAGPGEAVKCVDVGAQDWHYVFGLERWLRFGLGAGGTAAGRRDSAGDAAAPLPGDRAGGRRVVLAGIELDGHGIYPDFHSRLDYARAYAEQTGNPEVTYEAQDFLGCSLEGRDLVTLFYPFMTRHALLLWGLPLRCFDPARLLARAAAVTRPGGWLLVFCHTSEEHARCLELARASGRFDLLREGPALSDLVDFHRDVEDRRFSIWRRRG